MRFASVLVLRVLIFSSAVAQSSPVITLENAQQLTPLSSVKAPIPGALAWSADGRWLAAAASSGLNIIDTAEGDRVVHVLPDVITEAFFGADGLTFIAGGRLYDTISGDILLENVGGWADDEHRILFVRETGDVSALYPVTDREIGEQIISVPFAADRVLVPSVSPLVNGIFIRDIGRVSAEGSPYGEVTLWYWGDPPEPGPALGKRMQQTEQPNPPQPLYSRTFGWDDEPTVSISPDGLLVAIEAFNARDTIDAYRGLRLSCDCHYGAVFVDRETAPAQAVTRLVAGAESSSSEVTPRIFDVQGGRIIDQLSLPARPIPNDLPRFSTWDFTESARFVAIAAEQGVEVWRLDTPEPQQIAQLEGETVYAISEDGSRVLTGTGDVLTVWSLDDLAAPAAVTFTVPQSVYDATFDPDNTGALLLMNQAGGYQVWIEQSDGVWEAGPQNTEDRGSAAYQLSAGGRFLVRTAFYSGELTTVLDSQTGEVLVESSAGFAASPDSASLAVWDKNVLRIIDAADLQSRDVLTLPGVNGEFAMVNLPLDQAYIRDTASAEFDVYAIQTGDYQFSIPLADVSAYGVWSSFSEDGTRVVIAPFGQAATVWDVSGSSAVLLLELPENRVGFGARLNEDGTLLTTRRSLSEDERQALPDPTVRDRIVEVWDIGSSAVTHSIQTLRNPSAIFVPDTDLLFIHARGYVELWNLAAQPAVMQVRFDLRVDNAHEGIDMTFIDFNTDRTLALVEIRISGPDGGGGNIVMSIPLDVQSQDEVSVDSIYAGSDEYTGAPDLLDPRFSANETYALMNARYFLRALQSVVYRIDDQAFVDLPAQASAMTIDETAVVTANPLRVWSVDGLFSEEDPQPLAEYPVTGVESMAFSADGTLLYAWGQDGVTVWHVDG